MPIANDPLDPGRIATALDRLKMLVRGVVAAEKDADKQRNDALVAAGRERRVALERHAEAREQGRRELDAAARAELAQLEEFHVLRKERIESAYHASRKAFTARVQGERDGKVGKVQAEVLRNQQERGAEYAEAEQALAQVNEEEGQVFGELRAIEKKALKVLRSYRPVFEGRVRGKRGGVVEGEGSIERAEEALGAVGRNPLVQLFRWLPLLLLVAVAVGVVAWMSGEPANWEAWWKTAAIAAGGVVLVHVVGLVSAWASVARLSDELARIRTAGRARISAAAARVDELKGAMEGESTELREELSETLVTSDAESREVIAEGHRRLEERLAELPDREEQLHAARRSRAEARQAEALRRFEEQSTREERAIVATFEEASDAAEARRNEQLEQVGGEWAEVTSLVHHLSGLGEEGARRFPEWSQESLEAWRPAPTASEVVPVGEMSVRLGEFVGEMPEDPRFAVDEEALEIPLNLGFPELGSMVFEGDAVESASAVRSVVLRLLAGFPPGRVSFTFMDAVGLGRDFSGLMHLADYEDSVIHGRIWTQAQQIEERLAELNEHVEKVIQMYLRNEYATIREYNEKAGVIAEKYRFVVIAGFPSVLALERLGREDQVVHVAALAGRLALRREARAAVPIRAAGLVARPEEVLAALVGDHGRAVGDDGGEEEVLVVLERGAEACHVGQGRAQRFDHVVDHVRLVEAPVPLEAGEEDEEDHLAVGLAEDEALEVSPDLPQQRSAERGVEARHVAVVGEDPAPVLEGVTVEDRHRALGRLADVGEHRLGAHHAADPVEEGVGEGVRRALRHVGRAVDVVRDPPTVGVLHALPSQGVLRRDERAVDLALDDAAEPEEPAHGEECTTPSCPRSRPGPGSRCPGRPRS